MNSLLAGTLTLPWVFSFQCKHSYFPNYSHDMILGPITTPVTLFRACFNFLLSISPGLWWVSQALIFILISINLVRLSLSFCIFSVSWFLNPTYPYLFSWDPGKDKIMWYRLRLFFQVILTHLSTSFGCHYSNSPLGSKNLQFNLVLIVES